MVQKDRSSSDDTTSLGFKETPTGHQPSCGTFIDGNHLVPSDISVQMIPAIDSLRCGEDDYSVTACVRSNDA